MTGAQVRGLRNKARADAPQGSAGLPDTWMAILKVPVVNVPPGVYTSINVPFLPEAFVDLIGVVTLSQTCDVNHAWLD